MIAWCLGQLIVSKMNFMRDIYRHFLYSQVRLLAPETHGIWFRGLSHWWIKFNLLHRLNRQLVQWWLTLNLIGRTTVRSPATEVGWNHFMSELILYQIKLVVKTKKNSIHFLKMVFGKNDWILITF
jgi:hypothetical protein